MIKRKLFGILFFVLTCFMPLFGQTFKAGLTGGVTLSQIDGDQLGGFNKLGLQGGIRAAALFSERWQLGIELLYSQQGSRRINTDNPASIYEKIHLNMVEAPVLIHFSDWKFRVGAGLSYARIINYKIIDYSGADISEFQLLEPDVFSLVLGVTFNFNEHVGMDVRWSRYLNNIQADKEDAPFFGRLIGIRCLYTF